MEILVRTSSSRPSSTLYLGEGWGRRRTCPRRSPLGTEPFSRALDFSQEYGDFSIDMPLFSLYKIGESVMLKIFNNIPAKEEAS